MERELSKYPVKDRIGAFSQHPYYRQPARPDNLSIYGKEDFHGQKTVSQWNRYYQGRYRCDEPEQISSRQKDVINGDPMLISDLMHDRSDHHVSPRFLSPQFITESKESFLSNRSPHLESKSYFDSAKRSYQSPSMPKISPICPLDVPVFGTQANYSPFKLESPNRMNITPLKDFVHSADRFYPEECASPIKMSEYSSHCKDSKLASPPTDIQFLNDLRLRSPCAANWQDSGKSRFSRTLHTAMESDAFILTKDHIQQEFAERFLRESRGWSEEGSRDVSSNKHLEPFRAQVLSKVPSSPALIGSKPEMSSIPRSVIRTTKKATNGIEHISNKNEFLDNCHTMERLKQKCNETAAVRNNPQTSSFDYHGHQDADEVFGRLCAETRRNHDFDVNLSPPNLFEKLFSVNSDSLKRLNSGTSPEKPGLTTNHSFDNSFSNRATDKDRYDLYQRYLLAGDPEPRTVENRDKSTVTPRYSRLTASNNLEDQALNGLQSKCKLPYERQKESKMPKMDSVIENGTQLKLGFQHDRRDGDVNQIIDLVNEERSKSNYSLGCDRQVQPEGLRSYSGNENRLHAKLIPANTRQIDPENLRRDSKIGNETNSNDRKDISYWKDVDILKNDSNNGSTQSNMNVKSKKLDDDSLGFQDPSKGKDVNCKSAQRMEKKRTIHQSTHVKDVLYETGVGDSDCTDKCNANVGRNTSSNGYLTKFEKGPYKVFVEPKSVNETRCDNFDRSESVKYETVIAGDSLPYKNAPETHFDLKVCPEVEVGHEAKEASAMAQNTDQNYEATEQTSDPCGTAKLEMEVTDNEEDSGIDLKTETVVENDEIPDETIELDEPVESIENSAVEDTENEDVAKKRNLSREERAIQYAMQKFKEMEEKQNNKGKRRRRSEVSEKKVEQEDINTGDKTIMRDDSIMFTKKQRIDYPKKQQPVARKKICNSNGEQTKCNGPDCAIERDSCKVPRTNCKKKHQQDRSTSKNQSQEDKVSEKIKALESKNHNKQEFKQNEPPREKDNLHAKADMQQKSYLLVPSYKGFKDFSPIVLEGRTRRTSTQADVVKIGKPKFPILVVETVGEKRNEIFVRENEDLDAKIAKESLLAEKVFVENDGKSKSNIKHLSFNRMTGETVLHKAARLGYDDVVGIKIKEGADVNARDNAGWTALHEACVRGKIEVVRVLLHYGADPNCRSENGIRPLHDAVDCNNIDIIRLLLSYGADATLETDGGIKITQIARSKLVRDFLAGYAGDIQATSLSQHSPGDKNDCWQFHGSSALLDHEDSAKDDIFKDMPGDSDIHIEFIASNKQLLPTYNLPVYNDSLAVVGHKNYYILADILSQLSLSRNVFLKKHKVELRTVHWSEFAEHVNHSQVAILPDPPATTSDEEEPQIELVHIGQYTARKLFDFKAFQDLCFWAYKKQLQLSDTGKDSVYLTREFPKGTPSDHARNLNLRREKQMNTYSKTAEMKLACPSNR